jgi:hypothetical protein
MRTTRLLTRTSTWAGAAAAALLLSLTACSGGSDDISPSMADGGGDAGVAADQELPPDAPAPGDGDAATAYDGGARSDSGGRPDTAKAVDLETQQQALIKTGAVALRSDDVGKTRYDVQVLVDAHGGQVADDQTETDKSGSPLRSRMVLRVPVDDFDEVMDELAKLDTLASTSTSSEDVTTQLIDVEARIKVQEASVQRVRQLLARAASIRDIMAIENELANRQAQLDSLLQQQAYLADQTSMSTVKVSIERKPDPEKAAPQDDDDGFLAGLSAGWKGLKSTVVAVATVVGAVLPFAGVALVIGVPLWILFRRFRKTSLPAVPVTPAATTTD